MTRAEFLKLVDSWIAAGKRVAGPVRMSSGKVLYRLIGTGMELVLDSPTRPANSIKQFFLPPHERLFQYKLEGKRIELAASEPAPGDQVVIAARPCDASALEILDPLFNWDSADVFHNRRRRATTVLTLACPGPDQACFCTSVGSGPENTSGSDALLYPDGDQLGLSVLTEKGRKLFDSLRASSAAAKSPARVEARPPVKFELKAVGEFLARGFADPLWREHTLACLGCGACAYACPACHCFDIVDEGNARGGHRVKNWDSCQFPMFTAHASGHNPRAMQWQRQRQRLYHKFDIYPRKFGRTLCTGCGNCSRSCPASLGVLPILEAIGK